MKRRVFLLIAVTMLGGIALNAQEMAYTYVQQNGTKLEQFGTAAFGVSSNPEVTFVDGKAVMTVNGNTVAELPMDNGGQLVVEFTTTLEEDRLNKVEKEVGEAGYATFYSPFQLQVEPWSEVKVHIPTYDSENNVLKCNESTLVAAGNIIPAGTGLLLKNAHQAGFYITTGEATIAGKGALSGSALNIPTSSAALESGNVIYTLGHEKENKDLFGFFKYTGTSLNAGSAYLVAAKPSSSAKDFVELSFGDEATAIDGVDVNGQQSTVNSIFNLAGQKVGADYKGIVIVNGKKFIKQ